MDFFYILFKLVAEKQSKQSVQSEFLPEVAYKFLSNDQCWACYLLISYSY